MIKFAVIGIGRMGSRHAYNLFRGRVKGAGLVAVCDIAQTALDKYTVNRFKTVEELIEWGEFDAAVIATPHYSHVEIAEQLLGAGKRIIIEKPVSVTAAEAARLNELLKDKQAAAIVYNQRTNPVYKKAKELLSQNVLGEIRRVDTIITDWYRADAYYKNNEWRGTYGGEGGGLLINQCVHQLDLLTWLVGLPKSVFAHCKSRGREITAENEVAAIWSYENGATGTFSASGRELFGTNRIEIAGEKGRLVIGKYSMKYISFAQTEPIVNQNTTAGYGKTKKKTKHYRYGLSFVKDLIFGQQMRILQNFTRHILKGEDIIAPAEEGINAVMLFNAIYLSGWTAKEIALPIDTKLYDEKLKEKIEQEKPAKT
jgi:predicted dehydrogenase